MAWHRFCFFSGRDFISHSNRSTSQMKAAATQDIAFPIEYTAMVEYTAMGGGHGRRTTTWQNHEESFMRNNIACSLLALLVIGCGNPSTNPSSQTASTGNQPSGPPPPPATATALNASVDTGTPPKAGDSPSRGPMIDQALELWRNGQQDQAMAVFLAIDDWSLPGLTSADSLFAISEEAFRSASRSRRTELTEQLIQSNQTLRQLARHVIAAAKSESDATRAIGMLKQIEACGQWLQDPTRAKGVQQLGKGLSATAAREIEQVSGK